MSETRINSDGSATLTISGSSAPLEKALDSALKALDGFVKSASQALAAFDAYAAKGREGGASRREKIVAKIPLSAVAAAFGAKVVERRE